MAVGDYTSRVTFDEIYEKAKRTRAPHARHANEYSLYKGLLHDYSQVQLSLSGIYEERGKNHIRTIFSAASSGIFSIMAFLSIQNFLNRDHWNFTQISPLEPFPSIGFSIAAIVGLSVLVKSLNYYGELSRAQSICVNKQNELANAISQFSPQTFTQE